MNRGSGARDRPSLPCGHRFNEAPIHESGKWRQDPRGGPLSARFNEAPIHESGKWGAGQTSDNA